MYRKSIIVSLILIYLVIIAGAVVRMTGSGMGCPDWPKCFGYIIPPTSASELEWTPEKTYEKGQVIIVDETLRVAKTALQLPKLSIRKTGMGMINTIMPFLTLGIRGSSTLIACLARLPV